MMGLCESDATPRVTIATPTPHLVFWANPYSSDMPSTLAVDDFGTNFNYWVNGQQAVPEPGTFAMAALATSALLALRRKRIQ